MCEVEQKDEMLYVWILQILMQQLAPQRLIYDIDFISHSLHSALIMFGSKYPTVSHTASASVT